jgi:hypothetical protein
MEQNIHGDIRGSTGQIKRWGGLNARKHASRKQTFTEELLCHLGTDARLRRETPVQASWGRLRVRAAG